MKKRLYRPLIAVALLLTILANFLFVFINFPLPSSYKPESKIKITHDIDTTYEAKYIGHRGLSAIAPEDTIPAFEEAGKHGMWGAECDIWETSDGHFIICHNKTVDATTNGEGKIADKTLAELKQLKIDAGNNISEYTNLEMPTLEEYLDCCQKYDIVPVIEIKNIAASSVLKFIDILKKYDIEDKAVVLLSDYLNYE